MNTEELDLTQVITKEEAGISGYYPESSPDELFLDNADVFAQLDQELSTQAKSAPQEDTHDYSTEYPYLLINRNEFIHYLNRISDFKSYGFSRAVETGVTLRVEDTQEGTKVIQLIAPRLDSYFVGTLTGETDLPSGTVIYLPLEFCTKISKYLLPRILFYKKQVENMDRFFVRLSLNDLELINTSLIGSDLKLLDFNATVDYDSEVSIKASELYHTLDSHLKLISRISNKDNTSNGSSKVELISTDGYFYITNSQIRLVSESKLPNNTFTRSAVSYLVKASNQLPQDVEMRIYKATHEDGSEYLMFTDTQSQFYLRSNPRTITEDIKGEFFNNVPEYVSVSGTQLRDYVQYASVLPQADARSIIKVENGRLSFVINYTFGSSSELPIDITSNLSIEDGQFKFVTKLLLTALSVLDLSNLKLSLKQGALLLTDGYATLSITSIRF